MGIAHNRVRSTPLPRDRKAFGGASASVLMGATQGGVMVDNLGISVSDIETVDPLVRLNSRGLQMLAPSGSTQRPAIFFVGGYSDDPANETTKVMMTGAAGPSLVGDFGRFTLKGFGADSTSGGIEVVRSINNLVSAQLIAESGANAASVTVLVSDASTPRVVISEASLTLGTFTEDPSIPQDGDVWYRSDTDEIRARINGATRVLSHTAA